MIAALFVEPNGAYYGLPDVDPWDEKRDARLYAGPHPVVAHPPCSRWCRLAGLIEARWHGKTVGKGKRKRVASMKRGEDGGCFASALSSVRKWGGVLEHPAYSDAFAHYGLPAPKPGGWQKTIFGGWVCHVEQGNYGHPAKKATWLYAHGIGEPPSLEWSTIPDSESKALVSWCGNHVSSGEKRPRVGKRIASQTPEAFRSVLLGIARSVRDER
jgi:hypothetical protein